MPNLTVVALAAAIGVPAALLAAAYLAVTHVLEHWLWHTLPAALGSAAPPWFLVLGLPVLGAALVPTLLPGLVAAAVGYVVFIGIGIGIGDWGGVRTASLTVPGLPRYEGTSLRDLAVALLVGIVAAVVIRAVRRLGVGIDLLRGRVGIAALLLGGGLALGGLALVAQALGVDPQEVLFSGQASLGGVTTNPSLRVLVILLVAKALVYAVSLGCGFRGGPVFPATFLTE